MWVTAVALLLLLNDKYKLESLQGDGNRTRQAIPQTAGCKARACNVIVASENKSATNFTFFGFTLPCMLCIALKCVGLVVARA